MPGGGSADVFACTAAAQSSSKPRDSITDFDATADTFDFGGVVTGFDGTISGTVKSGVTFDSDIGNGGDLNGHVFVVVDVN